MASDARTLIFRFIKLTFTFFMVCAAVRFAYYSCTEGFSLQRIKNTIHERQELKLPGPSDKELDLMKRISAEPYQYLKKGSQAYAFISYDDKYILKLYKCHHLQPADWLLSIPAPEILKPWRNRLVERRKYKLNLTVSSFAIARNLLKEECGILYAQVLPTKSYSLPAELIDSLGRVYEVDLADYGFAFQRKAKLIFPSLEEWISKGDIESAKKALSSLVGLMARRSSKGVQDSDPDLHKNAGLVGTTAIFIDIGSFHLNPAVKNTDEMKRDIDKISKRLESWLEKKSPELHEYLKELLNEPWNVTWTPLHDEEAPRHPKTTSRIKLDSHLSH